MVQLSKNAGEVACMQAWLAISQLGVLTNATCASEPSPLPEEQVTASNFSTFDWTGNLLDNDSCSVEEFASYLSDRNLVYPEEGTNLDE